MLNNLIKRTLDVALSTLGIVVLSPFFLLISLGVKLTSPGPIFYGHARVGRFGKPFKALKFRTMVNDADKIGGPVTIAKDPRITRFGQFLRTTKLDELPQLWNVLIGEMSLVGPRPEVEQFVDKYPDEARRAILSVRPGITGLTQIELRYEAEVLANEEDPEEFYERALLPRKIASDLRYIENRSLLMDLSLLFRTFGAIFSRPPDSARSAPIHKTALTTPPAAPPSETHR